MNWSRWEKVWSIVSAPKSPDQFTTHLVWCLALVRWSCVSIWPGHRTRQGLVTRYGLVRCCDLVQSGLLAWMQEQEAGVTFSTVENHQDAKRCNALTSQRLGKLTSECNTQCIGLLAWRLKMDDVTCLHQCCVLIWFAHGLHHCNAMC